MLLPVDLIHRTWRLWHVALAWLEARAEPAIMRQRVNAGSEEYFADERHRGESEVHHLPGLSVAVDVGEDKVD